MKGRSFTAGMVVSASPGLASAQAHTRATSPPCRVVIAVWWRSSLITDQNGRSVRLLPCLSPFQSLLTATILVIVFLTLESSSLVSAATVPASDPCQLILQIMTPSSRNMSSIMRMCCVELRSSRRLVTKSVPRLPDPRENGLRRHWKLSSAGIGSGLGPGEPSAGPD